MGHSTGSGRSSGGAQKPQAQQTKAQAAPTVASLVSGIKSNKTAKHPSKDASQNGGYDGNGNAGLQKYQGQDNDKTASFLSSVDKNDGKSKAGIGNGGNKYQFYGSNDPDGFYNNPMQKLSLKLGMNAKPTVVSEADFNAIQQQTGAEVFYRGWSSRKSADQFMNSELTHLGTGVYGDGLYFANNQHTANSYGSGAMTKMMLSPNAKVIDYDTLHASMPKASTKLGRSLAYAGSLGSRSFSSNDGEAQWALKLGYNVVKVSKRGGNPYYYALTRDALIVSSKIY